MALLDTVNNDLHHRKENATDNGPNEDVSQLTVVLVVLYDR
jgi:hypothetical protein